MASPYWEGTPRKQGMVVKRGQGKSTFGRINWKERFLMLTDVELTYMTADPASGKATEKKSGIRLEWISSVQMVSNSAIGRENVFMVTYAEPSRRRSSSSTDDGAEYTLYIQVPSTIRGQQGKELSDWVTKIRLEKNAQRLRSSPSARALPSIPAGAAGAGAAGAGDSGRGDRSGSSVVQRQRRSLKLAQHIAKAIEDEDWYHLGGQQESCDKLRDMPVGSFFLRKSSNAAFVYSVDIRTDYDAHGNFVGSKRIKRLPNTNMYTYEGEDMSLTTKSVRDLLAATTEPVMNLPLGFNNYKNDAKEDGVHAHESAWDNTQIVSTAGGAMNDEDIYDVLEPDDDVSVSVSVSVSASSANGGGGGGSGGGGGDAHDSASFTSYSSGGDTGYEGSIEDIYDIVDNQQDIDDARPDQSTTAAAVRNVQLIMEGRKDSASLNARPVSVVAQALGGMPIPPAGGSKLWRDSSVRAKTLAATMDKKEAVLQEVIHEFIYSEKAYVEDVKTLKHVFVDQMHAQKLLAQESWFPAWREAVNKLVAEGSRFLKDLQQIQLETPGGEYGKVSVESIELASKRHELDVARALYKYCDHFTDTSLMLESPEPELAAFLQQALANPASKGLPINAYLLAPIQRIPRYPMLLDEIAKRSADDSEDKRRMQDASLKWRETANTCNHRLDEIKHWWDLKAIQKTLDFQRLTKEKCEVVPLWHPNMRYGSRLVVKRGGLTKINFDEKAEKVKNKRVIEVFLFSDYLVYATVNREKKTGNVRYLVLQMIHRSLAKCTAFVGKKKVDPVKGPFVLKIAVTLLTAEGGEMMVYFKANSDIERDRWLEAFNPRKEEDEYHKWDQQMVQAVKEFPGTEKDDLPLAIGDIVHVEKSGEKFGRGRLKDSDDPFSARVTTGWFPMDHVQELDVSPHKIAKEARKRASMKPGVSSKGRR